MQGVSAGDCICCRVSVVLKSAAGAGECRGECRGGGRVSAFQVTAG